MRRFDLPSALYVDVVTTLSGEAHHVGFELGRGLVVRRWVTWSPGSPMLTIHVDPRVTTHGFARLTSVEPVRVAYRIDWQDMARTISLDKRERVVVRDLRAGDAPGLDPGVPCGGNHPCVWSPAGVLAVQGPDMAVRVGGAVVRQGAGTGLSRWLDGVIRLVDEDHPAHGVVPFHNAAWSQDGGIAGVTPDNRLILDLGGTRGTLPDAPVGCRDPRIAAQGDGKYLVTCWVEGGPALVWQDVTAADLVPLTAAVPTLQPIGRPIWLAPGEVSGAPPDGAGYHAAPGNAEIILRPADLAQRVDSSKPFICIAEVAKTVTSEPCIGLFVHLGDEQSGWGTPIANARAQAARLGVPVYAYRDTGASIASELDTLRLLGVDRILLQAYPSPAGVEADAARIRVNADGCGPMLAGFLAASYTGAGAWPLADVLSLLALTWDEMRARTALDWFGLWPWTWHRAGRGGPNEHPEIRAMVESMAASVTGRPVAPLPDAPAPSDPPSPGHDPDPIPDPSEEDDMSTTVPAEIYLLHHSSDPTGRVVSLTKKGVRRALQVGESERLDVVPAGNNEYFMQNAHGRLHMNNEGGLGVSPLTADGAWERWRFIRGRAFVAKGSPGEVSQLLDAFATSTGLPL